VETVLELARQECRTRDELLPAQTFPALGEATLPAGPLMVHTGGAIVFVLDVARYERL
jgi:uncharacterized protein YaaQ